MTQHWKGLGSYGTVGLELALSIVFGLLIGRWLDKNFGSAPWMTIVWTGFGVAAGYRAVWRALKRANAEAEREEQAALEARKRFYERDSTDTD